MAGDTTRERTNEAKLNVKLYTGMEWMDGERKLGSDEIMN